MITYNFNILLVSVDPQRDTIDVLASLAAKREIDLQRWSLTRAQASDVRKIAAILGIQYRQLANKEFNHSTVLALVSRDGRILAKNNSTAIINPQFSATLRKALSDQ